MPPELRSLMLRYCQLGRLLPPRGGIDVRDPTDAELILAEMARIKAQIDDFLTANQDKAGWRTG
jgi:hypothetical protein